jgi:hypothetical protein
LADLKGIESVRVELNRLDPSLGDGFLVAITKIALSQASQDASTVKLLVELAYRWKLESPNPSRDIRELYGLMAYFMGNRAVDFIEKDRSLLRADDLRKLRTIGIQRLDAPAGGIGRRLQKLSTYIIQGQARYITQKLGGRLARALDKKAIIRPSSDIHLDGGFEVKSVFDGRNNEIAKLFVANPGKGARVSMSFDVGFRSGGLTSANFTPPHPGDQLVLDMAAGMTTPDGKPSEIAISRGFVENWIMSMDRAHGLILVYADGTMHIADKTHLMIHELYRDRAKMSRPDRRLDMRNMDDYLLFIDIARKEKLSANANLLLINGDERILIDDSKELRRLLVEFEDGRFGVLNVHAGATTAELAQLAYTVRLENGTRVVKATYLDTGTYDQMNLHTANGVQNLGVTSNASGNRLFIYQLVLPPSPRAHVIESPSLRESS